MDQSNLQHPVEIHSDELGSKDSDQEASSLEACHNGAIRLLPVHNNNNDKRNDSEILQECKLELEENDPWALINPPSTGKQWSDKTAKQKIKTVVKICFFICLLCLFLYIFICSLEFLSDAFRLLGGKKAGEAFRENKILGNPIANLMMGVMATVLLQSSSTTTTITVAMVASQVMPMRPAIFIVMGANIGTSVTNTIVSVGQAMDKNDFRRAFAGATVHDMFNWLSVMILLPVEWISGAFGSWRGCGLICQITGAITYSIKEQENHQKKELLKTITRPFSHLIIWVDQFVVTKIATWNETEKGPIPSDLSLMKTCYKEVKTPYLGIYKGQHAILWNNTWEKTPCGYLFEMVKDNWNERVIGGALLVLSLIVLLSCLLAMVKLLQLLLKGSIARLIKRFLNSNLPGRVGRFVSGYIAIIVGAGITMVLQSSSVFTSALTPLVGVGVLHIDRMYPLTLGANIGTTLTAILASMAFVDNFANALQIALCHLFFNLLGVLIWYPVPFMRKVPVNLAKRLGDTTGKYRWFPGLYIALVFFILPGVVFGLSVAGWEVFIGIAGPVVVFFIVIASINICQARCPKALPAFMRDWSCCPKFLHSFEPYHNIFRMICFCCKCKDDEIDSHSDDEDEIIKIKSGL